MITSLHFAKALLDRAVEKNISISPLKLQKLAYYCQGYFLAVHEMRMFQENIFAWKHGPVIDDIYHEYKCYGKNFIPHQKGNYFFELSEDNKRMIDYVLDTLGHFGGWSLRNKTHNESPWVNSYRGGLGDGSQITDTLMLEHFRHELSLAQDRQLANVLDSSDKIKKGINVINLPNNVSTEDDFVNWINSL